MTCRTDEGESSLLTLLICRSHPMIIARWIPRKLANLAELGILYVSLIQSRKLSKLSRMPGLWYRRDGARRKKQRPSLSKPKVFRLVLELFIIELLVCASDLLLHSLIWQEQEPKFEHVRDCSALGNPALKPSTLLAVHGLTRPASDGAEIRIGYAQAGGLWNRHNVLFLCTKLGLHLCFCLSKTGGEILALDRGVHLGFRIAFTLGTLWFCSRPAVRGRLHSINLRAR
jgi:hypothetical protein